MKNLWRFARLGVIILSILIFTPVIIPNNTYRPEIAGLPYTLWTGILAYFGFVALILTGILAHSRIYREVNSHD